MFYKKKYQQAVEERDAWRSICFERDEKILELRRTIRELHDSCVQLKKENEDFRKKDPFTYDKMKFQQLKNENAELKKEVEELRAENKGAKK